MARDRSSRRDAARSGSALLVVLVMLGLVGVLAAVIARVVAVAAAVSNAAGIETRSRAGLEAGIALAGSMIASGGSAGGLDGAAADLSLAGLSVSVTLHNERSRIDLNGGGPELLAGLFRALGAGDGADALAAKVVDWRDGDDEMEEGGAEADAYRQAGLPGPRNGPFVHPYELALVLGVTPELAARAAAFVTVANPQGLVDPFIADAEVIAAVPGVAPGRVAEFLDDRALGTTGRDAALLQLGADEEFVTEEDAPGYRVEIVVNPQNARPVTYEAVMIAGDDDAHPFRVLYVLEGTTQGRRDAAG